MKRQSKRLVREEDVDTVHFLKFYKSLCGRSDTETSIMDRIRCIQQLFPEQYKEASTGGAA